MAAVYYFAFDTQYSFDKDEYYFVYKDVEYKLIAGNDQYQHLLVTLVEDDKFPKQAANNALELLACLAWDSNSITEYNGSFGSGGKYTLEMISRYAQFRRCIPISEIKHKFPKKIINIIDDKTRNVASLFKEALIIRHSLPHYTFLSYWRLVEHIEGKDNPCEKIYSFIGWPFFQKKGFKSKKEIYNYLKDQVRNAAAHGSRGKKRITSIIDTEIFYELSEINNKLRYKLIQYIRKFLDKNSPLFLFNSEDFKYPTFMTEKEYFKKCRTSDDSINHLLTSIT